MTPSPEAAMECPACGHPLTANGCCRRCIGRGGGRPPRANHHEPEPTAAEVEALVAEQMAALPDWWEPPKDAGPAPVEIYRMPTCGRWNGKPLV